MILYTVVPLEDVLNGLEAVGKDLLELDYGGFKMQVSPISPNKVKIERILSTDPFAYLRQDIQPGMVLEMPLSPRSFLW